MNQKRQQFVIEYTIDWNATQAAIRAGYSEKTAGSIGHDLLKIPEIQAAIQERIDTIAMSKDEVLVRFGQMARGDIPTKETRTPTKTKTADKHTSRLEYDTLKATEDVAKVHAMMIDKHINIDIDEWEIVDDKDFDNKTSDTTPQTA